ncbi:thiol:disulfide interchange protein DsbA/DsbL [Undibacterium sp.]|jgi:thiol:disulfide interchange protein DsbA|uniref:thiol:disulfide interchange protein DsbA/DsbL n=1 Tax=Undibacterium sp. TaxID=1914977 RepID=UPI002B613F40|nr:thiol:disulfide interchange protein DsbA/DsbL [Undibacterium sp.]HTD06840.1 thiol:disulfide interchange protein DsbA/DsbL [Undibacterium sp.]
MRYLSFVFAAASLLAHVAFATPANPTDGAEYRTLLSPQPVQASGKKIEVIEVFMYHCPACNALEPELMEWVKKQGDGIVFRRLHMPYTEPNDPEAHLFLTLEAMKSEDALHDKVLRTWHIEQRRLKDDADNIDWAVKNGIDKAKFMEYYNSFAVKTKLQNMSRIVSNYQVDSTPTLIVDGRYVTNPGMVDAGNPGIPRQVLNKALLQVTDALVAKARAGKGEEPAKSAAR